jgi:hypothetical protein
MQYLISISLYAYHPTIAERSGIFSNNGYKNRISNNLTTFTIFPVHWNPLNSLHSEPVTLLLRKPPTHKQLQLIHFSIGHNQSHVGFKVLMASKSYESSLSGEKRRVFHRTGPLTISTIMTQISDSRLWSAIVLEHTHLLLPHQNERKLQGYSKLRM